MPERVGTWTVERRLGTGGMSSVWQVVDRRGEAGALKVLHGRCLQDRVIEAAFVHESRALARLDHPCIVPILDTGRITAAEAAGERVEGAPWLVVPLYGGGTLERGQPTHWAGVHTVLRRLLRALAHAHAAGFVHRDVKPGNVLLPRPLAWEEALLADFGLAVPLRAGRSGSVAGTPAFMAPEQFAPDPRIVDARADLYAVGGVAWTLVTGSPPHGDGTWAELRAAHRRGRLRDLEPTMRVPDRLEEWLVRLLAVEPAARPADAADALAGLDALAEPRVPWFAAPTLVPTEDDAVDDLVAPPARPHLPLPLRPDGDEAGGRRVSLAVLRLRAPPFVGRAEARARTWAWLGGGGTKGLVVEGPQGSGRSRFLQWLGDRVAEAGAATVWWMHHAPRPEAGSGPPGMLARWLRAEALDGAEVDVWLGRLALRGDLYGRADVPALAELIVPEPHPRVVFRDADERMAPVRRLAEKTAPLLVLVDDAQWAGEAWLLLAQLLDAALDVRLVVAVDPSRATPEALDALARLRAHPAVTTLALDPLRPDEAQALAERSLGLAPALATRLVTRAQGNPGFCVDVVREWWSGGRLVDGADGLQLRGDERIPDRLHSAWAAALLPLVDDRPRSWRHALELAASLGAEVSTDEWHAACAVAGVPAPDGLVDLGVHLGVFVPHPRGLRVGWRFVHGGLREVVLEHATARGRAPAWHRACAQALEGRGGPAHAERLADHLLDAGRPAEALPWLRRVALAEIDSGDRRTALARLDRLADALTRADVPAADPRRADLAWLRARLHRLLGHPDLAAAEASTGLALARAAGAVAEEVDAACELADAWRLQGRLDDADRLLAEVEPLAEANPAHRGAVLQRRGTVAFARGEVPGMLAFGQRARDAFLEAGEAVAAATSLNLVGCGLASAGHLEEALPMFARAVEEQDAAGCRWGAADAANNLGYVLIRLGRRADAAPVLERSIQLWERVGSPLGAHPRLNLARLHLEAGEVDAAAPHADVALGTARRLGWGPVALGTALATAWAVARRRGDPAADELREELDPLLEEPGVLAEVERLLLLG